MGIEKTIQCRFTENRHDLNVLEDLFNVLNFDCLIRADSSLSRCVSLISAPLVEVRPSNWDEVRKDENVVPIKDKNGCLIVDSKLVFRSEKGKNILSRKIAPIESRFIF